MSHSDSAMNGTLGEMARHLHRGIALSSLLAASLVGCTQASMETIDNGMALSPPASFFMADDGVALPVSEWEPADSESRGTVIALHSFGDFRLAFEEVGPELARAGYRVVAFDQRGFGTTPEQGRWAGEERMIRDALEVYNAVRAQTDAPVYLLGESMGGSVALLLAAEAEIPPDGLVLAAPGVREGIPFRRGWDVLLWLGERILPGAGVRLSRNYEGTLVDSAVERFGEDPRIVRRVRLDTYAGLVRLADDATEIAGQVAVPTLIFYGGEDGMVRPEAIRGLQRSLAGPVELIIEEQAPHLILQAPDQRARMDVLIDWLEGQKRL